MREQRLTFKLKGQHVITRGYAFGADVVYVPVSDSAYSQWVMLHKPTQSQLCRLNYDDFRLGLAVGKAIEGWDWRGNPIEAVRLKTRMLWDELYNGLQLDKSASTLREERVKARKMDKGRSEMPRLNLLPSNVTSIN